MQKVYILTSWLNLHCFQQEGIDYFLNFAHRELGLNNILFVNLQA